MVGGRKSTLKEKLVIGGGVTGLAISTYLLMEYCVDKVIFDGMNCFGGLLHDSLRVASYSLG